MNAPDAIAERALLDMSRVQRATLERWFAILIDAGETKQAEALRREIPTDERIAA